MGKVDDSKVRGHERHHPEGDSRPGLVTDKSQPRKGGWGQGKIFRARRSSTCDYTGSENNRANFSNWPFRLIRAVEGLQAMAGS